MEVREEKLNVCFLQYFCFLRGEKLYLVFPKAREEHLRRFVWWMICLILLAGAITIAALIGGKYRQLVLCGAGWYSGSHRS